MMEKKYSNYKTVNESQERRLKQENKNLKITKQNLENKMNSMQDEETRLRMDNLDLENRLRGFHSTNSADSLINEFSLEKRSNQRSSLSSNSSRRPLSRLSRISNNDLSIDALSIRPNTSSNFARGRSSIRSSRSSRPPSISSSRRSSISSSRRSSINSSRRSSISSSKTITQDQSMSIIP